MKHMQTDKYTIAWFKIADCVSRGEKERALGVYRLLSHSFNDDAVARQLEADIYLSCNEQDRAIFLYRQAMELYEKTQRILEAAAVCEHLIFLLPHDIVLRKLALNYYLSLEISSKIYSLFQEIIELYVHNNQWEAVVGCNVECEKSSNPTVRGMMYQQIISVAFRNEQCSDLIITCIEKALENFWEAGHEKSIQEFFGTLQALDAELYEYAAAYVKKE